MADILLTEKYRPKTLNEMVGQDISKVKEMIKEPMKMPNFLFVSRSPGTGKSTMAFAIKNEIGCPASDFLSCNSSDERKLEFIRDKLKPFSQSMRAKKDVPRLVMLDEMDGMLTATQEALRGLMEKYTKNVRFIITANDENGIIEPIRSRCVIIRFREPPKEDIFKRLDYICEQEKIKCDTIGLTKIVDMYYPDMRSMINNIQELASVGITEDKIKTITVEPKEPDDI